MKHKKIILSAITVALICSFFVGMVYGQGAINYVLHVVGNSYFENGNVYLKDGKYYTWNATSAAWDEQIGPPGAAGAAGVNGTNGSPGATGATGATGANGTNGTNGANGADAHQPINSASFVIHTFTNETGTFYAAQNGTSGLDQWTSTDATQTINNAIQNVNRDTGGIIQLTDGIFTINTTITIDRPIQFIGSGMGNVTGNTQTKLKQQSPAQNVASRSLKNCLPIK